MDGRNSRRVDITPRLQVRSLLAAFLPEEKSARLTIDDPFRLNSQAKQARDNADEGVQIDEPRSRSSHTSVQPSRAARDKGNRNGQQAEIPPRIVIDDPPRDASSKPSGPTDHVDRELAAHVGAPPFSRAQRGALSRAKPASKVFNLTRSEMEEDLPDSELDYTGRGKVMMEGASRPGSKGKSGKGNDKMLPDTVAKDLGTGLKSVQPAAHDMTSTPVPGRASQLKSSNLVQKERVSRARSAVDMGSIV